MFAGFVVKKPLNNTQNDERLATLVGTKDKGKSSRKTKEFSLENSNI